jgi:hypothetical protein
MVAGASISVAHGVVSKDGVSDQEVGVERVSNQLGWFCQQKFGFPVPARYLREHFLLLVRNMIFHNVVSCSSQLMSQGIMGHLGIGLTQLPLIEPPAGLVGPTGMLPRFREGPCQVLVTVSDVASSLDFVITGPLATDLPTVGSEVAYFSESADGTRLQQYRHSQNVSDPGQGHQPDEDPFPAETLQRPPFDLVDLSGQTIDHFFAALTRQQKSFLLAQQRRDDIRRQSLHISGLDLHGAVPRNHMLKTHEQATSDPDQMPPLPQNISQRTDLSRVNVAFLQDPQAQQLRQPEGFMLVVRMLQSIILLVGHRVGQMNLIAFFLEQVRQPVPIIGRFHNNPFQVGLVRLEKTPNQLGIIRKLSIDDMFPFLIDNPDDGVT